jgi:hypothetical protein
MNENVLLLISGIIASVFTIIGSVLTYLLTMRKFYKELLEKHYEKLYENRRMGYVILWKELRFFSKHNNSPEFSYKNLRECYEWLTYWYYDMEYGKYICQEKHKKYM